MEAALQRRERVRLWAAVGAGGCVVASLLGAAWLTVEAFEERRAATAAVDLRFAALTVSAVDNAASPPVRDRDRLADALDELSGDRRPALHALTPQDRTRANELLDAMAGCARDLMSDTDTDVAPHDHDELQDLLATAAEDASSAAHDAEGAAMVAIATAIAALAATGWMLLRSRYRSAHERALAAAARRLQVLVHDSPDLFVVVAPDGKVTYRSPRAARMLPGRDATIEDLAGRASPDDRTAVTQHVLAAGAKHRTRVFSLEWPDGERGWFELRVSDMRAEKALRGHLVTLHDITREVELKDDLLRQARTDVLTGLPNRRALDTVIQEASDGLDRPGKAMALLVLDLDGFKQINDTLGHHAGDVVLTHVAARLRRAADDDETVVRLGGDEFAVILPEVANHHDAQRRAEQLLATLDEPFEIGARTEQLRTSIGVALATEAGQVSALIAEADIAMYEAKRSGGQAVVVFDPDMEADALATSRIARALRSADHDCEFHLEYQPIVATADVSRVVGYEALLRWNSPHLGPVPPDEFIPVAEVSGEICSIGRWVFDAVCRQISRWNAEGLDRAVTVSANVSARELAEPHFVDCVLETAARWGVAADQITIEVTETSVLDHTGLARQRLEALRAAGFRISIDDFGSGYSNLGQLLGIPFDVIKIDRSLLLTLSTMREQAGGDPTDPCAIMEAIVSIAGVLGAGVLCEGVETDIQRQSLQRSGISLIQGYLAGRPTHPDLIQTHTTARPWPRTPEVVEATAR